MLTEREPLIFAFGPGETFFAACPGSLSNDGEPHLWGKELPAELQPIVTSHACVVVAFGANDSWICIYYSGPQTYTLAFSNNRTGLPARLVRWLEDLARDDDAEKLRDVKLCLCPDGMFFASSGYTYCYGGWSKPLEFLLKKHLECRDAKTFPDVVAVGAGSNGQKRIVIVGEGGDHTSVLGQDSGYGYLNDIIRGLNEEVVDETNVRTIEFVYLDAFTPGNFVIVSKSPSGIYEMFHSVGATLTSDAAACQSHIDGQPLNQQKVQLYSDLSLTRPEITSLLNQFASELEQKSTAITKYEEIFQLYDETLDAATTALKEKNDTIRQYEALIEQLRSEGRRDEFAAARAIREASAQANADFLMRQRAQNLQYQSQMVATAMQNMNTQRNVAMQNISTIFSNSMANVGNWSA